MPINKIVSTKRGKAAIAVAMTAAIAGGWHRATDTSAKVHPPAVILAKEALVKTWEGLVLTSHWDSFAKIHDICFGKTRVNGKPVTAGMKFTRAECEQMLEDELYQDYYLPLTKKITGYTDFPVSVQAAQLSGAYNFGVGGMVGSSAATLAKDARTLTLKSQIDAANKKYWAACEAQTAWNKAGKGANRKVVKGLVLRREMGDKQRIGEAELCVSGLEK